MTLRTTILALAIGLSAVVTAQVNDAPVPEGPLSAARRQAAQEECLLYFRKNGLKATDQQAARNVVDAFVQKQGLNHKADTVPVSFEECQKNAKDALEQEATRQFPIYTKEQLTEQAANKYPLYKVGERIKVSFMFNPRTAQTVSGIYQGTQGGLVRVGKYRFRLRDMDGIKDNETEIQKLDPDGTAILRKEFMEELAEKNTKGHEKFLRDHAEEYQKEALNKSSVTNEERGFTFSGEAWLTPLALLEEMAVKARAVYEMELEEQKLREKARQVAAVDAQYDSMELQARLAPAHTRLNPEKVLEQQRLAAEEAAAEEARRQEALAAKKKAEEEAAAAAAERKAARERAKAAKAEAANQPEAMEPPPDEALGSNKMLYVAGGVLCALVLLGMVCAFFIFKIKKKREKEVFTKFFQGEGELQQAFWAQADADPEHFKYVAYMFPSQKEATAALTRLSYIRADGSGQLHNSKDLEVGVYPHQEGAVCFVGGTNFHYAAWREATSVLPELPNAVYFKVSTEPDVALELPDEEKLRLLHIESQGVEEQENPEGGFIRCYKYTSDSRENALVFLQDFEITEEGITIHVETPEGTLGKDENGIFEI
ncbi:MAG: hypothetical protein IJJ33_10650 [Victivallales bacterium]|nr:hypothetical protein [Victivallales bacterium]